MDGVKLGGEEGGRWECCMFLKKGGISRKKKKKTKEHWYTFPHNARKIEMLSANNIIEDILNGESLIRIQEIILDPK